MELCFFEIFSGIAHNSKKKRNKMLRYKHTNLTYVILKKHAISNLKANHSANPNNFNFLSGNINSPSIPSQTM